MPNNLAPQTELTEGYALILSGLDHVIKHFRERSDIGLSKPAAALMHSTLEASEALRKNVVTLSSRAGDEIRAHPLLSASIAATAASLVTFALTHARHEHEDKPAADAGKQRAANG